MRAALPIIGWVLALITIITLLALAAISFEANMRSRDCFEAGGRVVNEVCMPVEGALKP